MIKIIKFDLRKLEKSNTLFGNYIIGRSYDLEENGVKRDNKKALEFYKKGFDVNYPLSIYSIGMSYLFGLGEELSIDEEKGQKLLELAWADLLKMQDNEELDVNERLYAKFVTAAYYNYGIGGVHQNLEKARKILEECAEQGHIAAFYDLGYKFYYSGVGGNKNLKKAEQYLRIAKDNGLPRAIEKYEEYYKTESIENIDYV